MTEADHADLSRRLALAIGCPENSAIRGYTGAHVWWRNKWRRFDYRDPAVIWPIAERYRAFPVRTSDGVWHAYSYVGNTNDKGDTAAEAVARAVIGARG